MIHALALLVLIDSAPEPTPHSCQSYWTEDLKAAEENGWTAREMGAAQRETFMRWYNAKDPPTDYKASHVYVVTRPNSPVSIEIIEGEDCVVNGDVVSPEDFQKALDAAEGQKI